MQEKVSCEATSRTDRGVHAQGQVVQFFSSKPRNAETLIRGLNALLPRDIRVRENTLHCPLDATSKTYHYLLCLGSVQDPFYRKFSWHYPYPIDLALLQSASTQLLGTHNFSAFSTDPPEDPVRTLLGLELTPLPGQRLLIAMTGDRFLYKMARTIAGTLANIGSGKLPENLIPRLLTQPDRTLAGMTAPAHGLTLQAISFAKINSNELHSILV